LCDLTLFVFSFS
jgi:hypothetical protein